MDKFLERDTRNLDRDDFAPVCANCGEDLLEDEPRQVVRYQDGVGEICTVCAGEMEQRRSAYGEELFQFVSAMNRAHFLGMEKEKP